MGSKTGATGRKRKGGTTPSMVQTALWLPREVHERLKKAGGERGLGEEIRKRLESSFVAETDDPVTTRLLAEIADLAGQVTSVNTAPWHVNPWSYEFFEGGVLRLLASIRPKGEAKPDPAGLADVLYREEDLKRPANLGAISAAGIIAKRSK